jgi:transcriptional regulator with XRE-family HTH domain
MSQQEVAAKLGISRQMVGLLETGERPFTARMAVLVERELGIPRMSVCPDPWERAAA